MSIIGKIQSIFLDREKTQPIFPITKTKAVSDENGRSLDVLLDDKASKDFVTAKIAEAQLGGDSGEIDLSGFATKDDLKVVDDKIPTTPEQIGARPNTWMPTASDVGAAPAEYGLGGKAPYKLYNDATECGFYNFWIETSDGYKGYATFETISSDQYPLTVQKFTRSDAVNMQRVGLNGAWGEWEFVNPPMIPGVEYRTTERWNGRVVYAKCVDCGNLVPGSATAVYPNIGMPIRWSGRTESGTALPFVPYVNDRSTDITIGVQPGTIFISAGSAREAEKVYVSVWYVQ